MSEHQSIPAHYIPYRQHINDSLARAYQTANVAKQQGLDPSTSVESPMATDLPDRVAKLLDIPVAERLRSLLGQQRTEQVALLVASEVASGKYPIPRGQTFAEAAVRIGLAIVTDGVTVAPIQGISAVRIKENRANSNYLSVEFAGPIRSAGGTESALTLVIADQVRKAQGLEKYNATAHDDEPSRFIEELRIYERDVGSFQYKITDQDVRKALSNLPVEIDGVWTDNYEVVVHRDMRRISTNKVRGGALRVLNDGVVGKSKKLLKLLKELQIDDWNWLSELSGGKQQGTEETKAVSSHFGDVISGRPVLSMPNGQGGFRLRYGRAVNTGIHAVGVHPCVSVLLDYPIVCGTQIKVDKPGKAASIAFVDTIETPIVKLKDESVIRLKNVHHASELVSKISSILYMGDILVSFGDFLENNVKLLPSAYVEEWWSLDLKNALGKRYSSLESAQKELNVDSARLEELFLHPLAKFPSFEEAERISRITLTPLHPRYLFFWDQLEPDQIIELRKNMVFTSETQEIRIPLDYKSFLEALGVEHYVKGQNAVIDGEQCKILTISLALNEPDRINKIHDWNNSTELVSQLSGIPIRKKSSTFIGVRVGRPEKAMPRKMKPPIHGLFPVGKSEGLSRDILVAQTRDVFTVELLNSECPECKIRVFSAKCQICKKEPRISLSCANCTKTTYDLNQLKCTTCKGPMKKSSSFTYPLQHELKAASLRTGYNPVKPLKGVLGLSNELKIPEKLEKILLRQKYGLSVYRDGTIRYDLTNVPLTHFRPRQIHTTVETLRKLGYEHDIEGAILTNEEQVVELLAQDIIIPFEAGDFLHSVSKYVDDLLISHYGVDEPFYNIHSREGVLGHFIIGLAPHTSVGIVGRVIGYTNAQACFATPYWHSAKRRDCDGDGDSIILLMDVLLNFSKSFLPSIIGGLMDAPLLIQPFIIPREVQRQVHHMDVMAMYPEEFFKATLKEESPVIVEPMIDMIKGRLGTKEQFQNFGYTHDTHDITIKQSRSSYSTLVTLNEKLDRQIEIAEKIRAVDSTEVVKSVLRTHLLPDIIGNTKAFTSQSFRCKKCGSKFRRIPVRGNCLNCGGELQPNVTRGSVEKYLQLGLRLSQKYEVGGYLRSRFIMAEEELATLFKKPTGQQTELSDFSAQSTSPPKNEYVNERATKERNNLLLGEDNSVDNGKERNQSKPTKRKKVSEQTTLF